jgi:hypothetical protein
MNLPRAIEVSITPSIDTSIALLVSWLVEGRRTRATCAEARKPSIRGCGERKSCAPFCGRVASQRRFVRSSRASVSLQQQPACRRRHHAEPRAARRSCDRASEPWITGSSSMKILRRGEASWASREIV